MSLRPWLLICASLLAVGCGPEGTLEGGAWEDDPLGSTELALDGGSPRVHRYFQLRLVSDAGVPAAGVTVATNSNIRLTSDRNGVVAFYEPGLMDQTVYFKPVRDWACPAARSELGRSLVTTEGASATLAVPCTGVVNLSALDSDDSQLVAGTVPGPQQLFSIEVVDDVTQRGIPLVSVSTPRKEFVTDSQGRVAFYDLQQMGQRLTWTLASDGYAGTSVTADALPGGSLRVSMHRTNVAERLYRLTGQGIYRDTVMLGLPVPTSRPLLNAQVAGQDTVMTAVFNGKVFWVFGDTVNIAKWATGWNFRATAATSALPGNGALDPSVGVDLSYFPGTYGFVQPMTSTAWVAPTWLGGLAVVPGQSGGEALFANYVSNASGTTKVRGMAKFDPSTRKFLSVWTFSGTDVVRPSSSPLPVTVSGQPWTYYSNGVRIPGSEAAMKAPSTWQAFTALRQGSGSQVERDASGVAVYRWRTGTRPLSINDIGSTALLPDRRDSLVGQVRDVESGGAVRLGASSIGYNPYRGRYTSIIQQELGSPSLLGEIFYAEADTPMGPWLYARKVLSHPSGYNFYNPRALPFFDQNGGQTVYFTGSYTTQLTGTNGPRQTPRYEYNEIVYRLDLQDSRLVLPVPVYRPWQDRAVLLTRAGLRLGMPDSAAAFLAPDRPGPGLVPFGWQAGSPCSARVLVANPGPASDTLFWAYPYVAGAAAPRGTQGLFADVNTTTGERRYAVATTAPQPGFSRPVAPVAYVWPNPVRSALPVSDHLDPVSAAAARDACAP